MAAVSETIVREYFELHGFLVRQQRKYIAPTRREDEEIDFFVMNPQPRERGTPLPFILASEDLPGVTRAIVVVKGWHTETFSPAVLANAPEIFRFVEPGVFKRASESFGDDGTLTKILIVPALPQAEEARLESPCCARRALTLSFRFARCSVIWWTRPKSTGIIKNPTCCKSSAC
jgi:hypothetical protein